MDGSVNQQIAGPVAGGIQAAATTERLRVGPEDGTQWQPPSGSSAAALAPDVKRKLTHIGRIGWVLFGLQLMGLLVFSSLEYQRYAVSVGFGTYAQAWVAIAHGHLDPTSTLIGKPFWRNDAEFIIWPLSALYVLYPHPVDLLWVQDIALVLTEAVAFRWLIEIIRDGERESHETIGPLLAAGALCVLLVEPFSYMTVAYDVHSEVIAALFAVLAARALWSSRMRQLWWWVPLALMTDAFAGLYIIGIGVSGVVSGRRTRRTGLILIGAGLAWIILISAIGGDEFGYTHSLSEWYGYLAGHRATIGPFDVFVGVLSHPMTATHMILTRWKFIFDFLVVMGFIGLASAWGWPMACVVIVPSALNANVAFLNPHAVLSDLARSSLCTGRVGHGDSTPRLGSRQVTGHRCRRGGDMGDRHRCRGRGPPTRHPRLRAIGRFCAGGAARPFGRRHPAAGRSDRIVGRRRTFCQPEHRLCVRSVQSDLPGEPPGRRIRAGPGRGEQRSETVDGQRGRAVRPASTRRESDGRPRERLRPRMATAARNVSRLATLTFRVESVPYRNSTNGLTLPMHPR